MRRLVPCDGRPLVGGYLSRDLPYPLQDQFPMIQMFAHARPVTDVLDQDPVDLMQSWTTSVYLDDAAPAGTDERFQQKSWNMRSLVGFFNDGVYPLALLELNFKLPAGRTYSDFARSMQAEGYFCLYGIPGDQTHFQLSTIGAARVLGLDKQIERRTGKKTLGFRADMEWVHVLYNHSILAALVALYILFVECVLTGELKLGRDVPAVMLECATVMRRLWAQLSAIGVGQVIHLWGSAGTVELTLFAMVFAIGVGIPVGYLAERLDEIPTDRPVVLHCQGGARSAIAASVLQARGLDNVVNMVGGFVVTDRMLQMFTRKKPKPVKVDQNGAGA